MRALFFSIYTRYTSAMGFWHKHARLVILFILAVFCVLVWAAVLSRASAASGEPPRKQELLLAVLNVGQGDAIFIQSPTGVQVLIDGGPDSAVLRELPKVMPALDRSIDAVIATHPDQDHIGGLVDVLQRYEVGIFMEPGVAKNTATYRALMQEVREQNIEHTVARRGLTLELGDGATLTVLYPHTDVSGADANDASIVVQLVYASSSALLMGDAPKYVETVVVALDGARLQSDVLKAGHHGSRTSTSDLFVQTVQPSVAVISAGKNNSYGHPHAEVLQTLARFGVRVLQTAQLGTIRCTSSGAVFACN